MKRLMIGAVIAFAMLMTACNKEEITKEDKVSVVCTVFPAYDWTCELLKGQTNNVDVEYLFDDGADVHSFQPGADDYVKIAESDIFIYFSGPGTAWIEEALANSKNDKRIVVDLTQALGVDLLENTVDTHNHEEEEEEHAEHVHEGDLGYDEHIWMSISNAEACVYEIEQELCKVMPDERTDIRANSDAYIMQLENLDAMYKDAISEEVGPYILVADRFPFRYLTEEYGIEYDAAFAGCQTEAEADFDMIIRLAAIVEKENLHAIIVTEVSDRKLAETVWENTDVENGAIVVLDSMQAVTASDIKDGVSYISIMEKNLDAIKSTF